MDDLRKYGWVNGECTGGRMVGARVDELLMYG